MRDLIMTPPFAWLDKCVLRRIRENCEDPGTAIAVYVALAEVASDKGCDEFQATHTWLASLCGLSNRTVQRRLADLSRIGAVAITTTALKAPCTYRLLRDAIGNHWRYEFTLN